MYLGSIKFMGIIFPQNWEVNITQNLSRKFINKPKQRKLQYEELKYYKKLLTFVVCDLTLGVSNFSLRKLAIHYGTLTAKPTSTGKKILP